MTASVTATRRKSARVMRTARWSAAPRPRATPAIATVTARTCAKNVSALFVFMQCYFQYYNSLSYVMMAGMK